MENKTNMKDMIFYHNDLDGISAAATVQYFNDWTIRFDHLIKMNYTRSITEFEVDKDAIVYVVDYSLKKEEIDYLLENCKKLIWIDHHASSGRILNEYNEFFIEMEELDKLELYYNPSYCGAYNTYEYFTKGESFIPKFLEYVDLWDTWKWNKCEDEDLGMNSLYFKYGIDLLHIGVQHVEIFNKLFKNDKEFLEETIECGKTVLRYINSHCKEYLDRFGFNTVIDGYSILACNYKFNSFLFGQDMDNFDAVCAFAFNGEKWSYSLYSTKEYVDCSKISESFNGGGHKGAAGFTIPENIFEDNRGRIDFSGIEVIDLLKTVEVHNNKVNKNFFFEDNKENILSLSIQFGTYFAKEGNKKTCYDYELSIEMNGKLIESDNHLADLFVDFRYLFSIIDKFKFGVCYHVTPRLADEVFKYMKSKFTYLGV